MVSKSREKKVGDVVALVRSGTTCRKASERYIVPRSTIHSIQSMSPSGQEIRAIRAGMRTFTPMEEELVLTLITRYAERGIPLKRRHVEEAIAT